MSTDDELCSFALDVAAVDPSSGTPLVELSAELPAPAPLGSVDLVNTREPADTRTENLTITWHVAGPIRPESVPDIRAA